MAKKKTVEASSFLKNKAKENSGSSVTGTASSSNAENTSNDNKKVSSFLEKKANESSSNKQNTEKSNLSDAQQVQILKNLQRVAMEQNNTARSTPLSNSERLGILSTGIKDNRTNAQQIEADIVRRRDASARVGVQKNNQKKASAYVLNDINAPAGFKSNLEAGNAAVASSATKVPDSSLNKTNNAGKYPYLSNGITYEVARRTAANAEKMMNDAYDRASKLDNTYYGDLPNEEFKAALAEAEQRKKDYEKAVELARGAKEDQDQWLLNEGGYRKANLKDVTVNSLLRGLANSLYGEAVFNEGVMDSPLYRDALGNNSDYYKEYLDSDEMKFVADGTVSEAVSGAFETLIGQQLYQNLNPKAQLSAWAAVGAALLGGQAGPQIGLPEEIVTVPGAYMLGLHAASSVSNAEIEAGQAYAEMIDAGVSENTARKMAMAVGGVNGILEFMQMDEAIDGIKALNSNPMTKGFARRLATELKDKGLGVANETLQEVLQENTTITGVNAASMIDKGEKEIQNWEKADRLKETATSSALTFGAGALAGLGGGYARNYADYSIEKNKAFKNLYEKLGDGENLTSDDVRQLAENIDTDLVNADKKTQDKILKQADALKKEAETVAEKMDNGTAKKEEIGKFVYDAKMYSDAFDEASKTEETVETNEESKEVQEKKYGFNVAFNVATDLDKNGQQAIADVLSSVAEENKGNIAVAFQKVYDIGRYNITSQQDSAYSYAESKGMTPQQISYAFKAGQMDYQAETKQTYKANNVVGGASADVFKSDFDNDVKKYLSGVGGKIRATIDIASSDPKSSKYMSPNEGAKWDAKNRVLTINPKANDVVGSLWHDITHVIQDTSPSEYINYRDFVVNYLANKEGIDKETFLENMIAKYQTMYEVHTGKKMRRSEIIDEIVSDAAMEFSTDEKAVKQFVKEHKTLATKIIDFFEQVIDALNSFFGRTKGNEVSAKLKEDMDSWMKARDLWYKALKATNESNQMVDRSENIEHINEGFMYSLGSEYDNNVKVRMGTMFSGAGTFDFALRNMIAHEYAVEYNQQISEVYKTNNGNKIFVGDVREAARQGYLKKNIDYLHASPVCCNFSHQQVGDGEQTLDKKTAKAVAKAIKDGNPKIVTVENVAGYQNSEALQIIKDALKKNGYKFDEDVYNSYDFGSAQSRDRYFLRAIKKEGKNDTEMPAKPMPTNNGKTWYEVSKDLIEDCKPMPFKEGGYLLKRWNKIKDGVDTSHPVLILYGTKGESLAYAEWNKPSPTLIAKITEARIVMPDGRVLGVSSDILKRLQGLPDSFTLPTKKNGEVSKTLSNRVIGNGIPVELSQAVAGSLMTQIEGVNNVRFSLSSSVEQTDNLIALHNINEEKLLDAISRGGLIMPSMAVTNKKFTSFGDISLIFEKSSIDPNANSSNKLYGSDAWTPTHTKLKKNAKFDRASVDYTISEIKNSIGKHANELFNVSSEQFENDIKEKDGSVYTAYSNNIGMQTAYEMQNGLIDSIPETKDGHIDYESLKDMLNSNLDSDSEWRSYKGWLNNISDTVISEYDRATNSDIINNMNKQPDFAKKFRLSFDGKLTAPTSEYKSVDTMRENKGRLNENAAKENEKVAEKFMSLVSKIAFESNVSKKNVVNAINSAFDNRYTVNSIRNTFAENGITINNNTAQTIQNLYKETVNLPTEYFEAKPRRTVGLEEIDTAVIPDKSSKELKSALSENGIRYIEYKAGNEQSRIDALNSRNDVRFSLDSNGNKLTEQQAEYFKDSKVRDENGNLLVVYHGSPATDINSFDRNKAGNHSLSYNDNAIWFTDNKEFADGFSYEFDYNSNYTYSRGEKGKLYETYLNMDNPFDLRSLKTGYEKYLQELANKKSFDDALKAGNHQIAKSMLDFNAIEDAGYDGVISFTDMKHDTTEYGVFSSNQAKLIDNTNPTESDDIRYSLTFEEAKENLNRDGESDVKRGLNFNGEALMYKLLNGEKTMEVRPTKSIKKNTRYAIVDTDPSSDSYGMITGYATFGNPVRLTADNFHEYDEQHLDKGTKYADFNDGQTKWGYPITEVHKLDKSEYWEATKNTNQSMRWVQEKVSKVGLTYDSDAREAYIDRLSLTTFNASDYVTNVEKAAEALAKANDISVEKAKQYIKDVTSVAKMIATSKGRLDYIDSGLSPFVSNSEYGGSFDFDTSCAKRRLFAGTFAEIQKRLGNEVLTAGDYLKIRELMIRDNLEAYCAKCYVEGSRAKMGEYAEEFRKLYKKYYPDRWQPDQLHLVTEEGYEWMRLNHPEAYESVVYFWNNHGTLKEGDKAIFSTQAKPKLFMSHSAYKDEILKNFTKLDEVETEKVKQKNENGGIRFNSFSDAEIIHIIDAMQALLDMSRVGLAGQAYSKQENFINAFGNTGLKINISIDAWGVDENGNLVFNDVEGVPHEKAFALRKKFSRDVGTILCVYDDAMLKAALNDDRIDFIIPFHRSQWKKSQYKAMGLPDSTKDYTNQQNEKWLNPDSHTHEWKGKTVKTKCENYMPNSYWEYDKDGVYNANKYLDKCAEDGKRPKFYKFLDIGKDSHGRTRYFLKEDGSTDGYWKLLIDFKMYGTGKDGKIDYSYNAEQTSVRPEFNMTDIRKMMKDYTGDGSKLPVASGIVDEFVKMRNNGERFSLSVDDYIDEKSQEYAREEQKALIEMMRDSMNIQYGDRTLPAYYEGLRKANDAVGQYLRNTHYVPEKSAIRNVAKSMKAETESAKSIDEIVDKLTPLYEYINNDKFVDGDTVSNTAKDIAEWMLGDQTEYYDDTEVARYKELKEAIKSHTILVEDDHLGDLDQYGGYNDVRKKYFGTLKVSRTKGRTAEAVLESIREEYPGLIPYETENYNLENPAGALDYLIERLETEKPKPRMRDADYDAWTYSVGQKIFDAYFDTDFVPGDQTGQELLAEYRKGLKEFQSESRNEKKYKDKVAQMRKRWSKYKENESTRATKNSIMKSARRLTSMLKSPTNTKHVPESFRVPLAKFLDNIYFGTSDVTSQRTVEWSKMMNVVNKIIANPDSTIDENGTSIFLTVDPDLGNKMEKLLDKVDHVVDLDKMSRDDLRTLNEVFKGISKIIETSDKMLGDKQKRRVSYFGDGTIGDLTGLKNSREFDSAVGVLKTLTSNQMLDSYTRFHTFGKHAEEILDNILDGFRQKVRYTQDAKQYIDNAKEEVGVTEQEINDWKVKDTIKISDTELTVQQMMSLYELMKRKQARPHILEGGITPTKFVKKSGTLTNVLNEVTRSGGNHKFTEQEINEALKQFETDYPKAKEMADRIARYFNVCAEWGNKTSLAVYGYAKFKDPNYFPIDTDPNVSGTKKETNEKGNVVPPSSLKSVSAAKQTTENANNAIMIDHIFDVFANHVDTMSSYGSLLIPLDDAQKWIGYKTADNKGTDYSNSVRGMISNVYGNSAVGYVTQLIREMNGAEIGQHKYFADALVSAFKGSAVGFNLSVAIQQPTAYLRAMAVIEPKYLLKALDLKDYKADYELIKKYSALAQWKDWGFYDINIGKSMDSILTGPNTKMDKLRDASMWLAGKGDEVTWGRLWVASELKVQDETNLKVGTDEYYEEVARVFEDIINRTQVIDSTLNRSQIMRNKNSLTKLSTAFMGEPMKSYNLLYRAVFDCATNNTKENKQKLAMAGAGFILSNAAAALAKSFIVAMRTGGAGRDKEFWERWYEAFVSEFLGNLNPVSYMPFIKDVYSMVVEGNDVERADLTAVKDWTYVWNRWFGTNSDKYTILSKIAYSTKVLSSATGVSFYGLQRDLNAVVDTMLGAFGLDQLAYIKYKAGRTVEKNQSEFVGIALRYYMEGKTALADQVVQDILEVNPEEKELHEKVVNELSKDEEKARKILETGTESMKVDALKALYNIEKGDRKNLSKAEEIEIIDGMNLTDEQKGTLYESKFSTEALNTFVEFGGTPYEYMKYGNGLKANQIENLMKQGVTYDEYINGAKHKTEKANSVSENTTAKWNEGIDKANDDKKVTNDESLDLAIEMLKGNYDQDEVGILYQQQTNDMYFDKFDGSAEDYLFSRNDILDYNEEMKSSGMSSEERKKAVASRIKSYNLSEENNKILWEIAGFKVDGTENKEVVENKNYDKYFKQQGFWDNTNKDFDDMLESISQSDMNDNDKAKKIAKFIDENAEDLSYVDLENMYQNYTNYTMEDQKLFQMSMAYLFSKLPEDQRNGKTEKEFIDEFFEEKGNKKYIGSYGGETVENGLYYGDENKGFTKTKKK